MSAAPSLLSRGTGRLTRPKDVRPLPSAPAALPLFSNASAENTPRVALTPAQEKQAAERMATQADLLQRISLKQLTQLTDDANQGQPDATVVGAALEEASGLVDARVRDRYTTPLQASDTATAICRDICVYLLFTRRPQQISEAVRQRYEDAISLLKEIAAGKASLDQPVSAAAPQSVPSGPVTPVCSKLRMTERNLEGFI